MPWLRSLLFNICYFAWTFVLAVGGLPVLLMPRRAVYPYSRLWAHGVIWLLRHIVGTRHRILGRERIPDGPVIYAVQHQSAWETMIYAPLIPRFAGVFKKELLAIPIYGWYLQRADMIPIDRAAGAGALRRMLRKARAVVADGRAIVVMPEGTRVAPGQRRPYHPGVAALYLDLGLPVVPAALNSGYFWGRRSFVKRPGLITMEFLEPIPPGLDRKTFMKRLQSEIETAAERLGAEAKRQLAD